MFIWFEFRVFFSSIACQNNPKEPSLPYRLPIAGEKSDGFMFSPKPLAQIETQSASFRFWTQVTDSISYDNNRSTKLASLSGDCVSK